MFTYKEKLSKNQFNRKKRTIPISRFFTDGNGFLQSSNVAPAFVNLYTDSNYGPDYLGVGLPGIRKAININSFGDERRLYKTDTGYHIKLKHSKFIMDTDPITSRLESNNPLPGYRDLKIDLEYGFNSSPADGYEYLENLIDKTHSKHMYPHSRPSTLSKALRASLVILAGSGNVIINPLMVRIFKNLFSSYTDGLDASAKNKDFVYSFSLRKDSYIGATDVFKLSAFLHNSSNVGYLTNIQKTDEFKQNITKFSLVSLPHDQFHMSHQTMEDIKYLLLMNRIAFSLLVNCHYASSQYWTGAETPVNSLYAWARTDLRSGRELKAAEAKVLDGTLSAKAYFEIFKEYIKESYDVSLRLPDHLKFAPSASRNISDEENRLRFDLEINNLTDLAENTYPALAQRNQYLFQRLFDSILAYVGMLNGSPIDFYLFREVLDVYEKEGLI